MRLVLDSGFRQRFHAAPAATLAPFQLSSEEPWRVLAERFCLVFHDVGISRATAGQETARRQRTIDH